jgi:hypothetical protein
VPTHTPVRGLFPSAPPPRPLFRRIGPLLASREPLGGPSARPLSLAESGNQLHLQELRNVGHLLGTAEKPEAVPDDALDVEGLSPPGDEPAPEEGAAA